MLIKQISDLVYREIDNKYYITNTQRHEVVVLNEAAFRILELAHEKTVEEICEALESSNVCLCNHEEGNDTEQEASIKAFLDQLRASGLIMFEKI